MPRVPSGYERQSSTTTRSAADAVATTAKATAKTARRARVDLMELWRIVQSSALAAFRGPGRTRQDRAKEVSRVNFLPLPCPRPFTDYSTVDDNLAGQFAY